MSGTKTVRTIPVHVAASPSGGTAYDCEATIALTDLAPGTYALQLTVQTPRGKVTPPPVGIEIH